MLSRLTIRDIVLIDRLDLEFGPGLTVLTGETGAGKSILLDAFALALGGRGDGGLVRHGEKQGQVTAVFDLSAQHPALALARQNDIEVEGDLILRRVQVADGRTRAFVNDAPVSAQVLRALSRTLVEIHGQHDERALVDPDLHRMLVDAFGGLDTLVSTVRACHAARRTIEADLKGETARVSKARADADFLQHAAEELGSLAPQVGEEEKLASRRADMMAAEKVASDLRDAYEAVSGNGSPTSTLSALVRRLERRAAQAPSLIDPCTQAIDAVLLALDGASAAIGQALDDAAYDPHELERVEERLFALRALARKHACGPDDLPALADKFTADLAALDAGEARLKSLQIAQTAALKAYVEAAQALGAERRKAAQALDAAVNAELPPLKLERARFETEIETEAGSGGPDGTDRVEFWVATNPGSRPGPLTKVASGGELARFMLALKVSLADRGSAPTLVFDEIDTGVGGAVADAIGRRLARLADRVQVLAVTHAPQVAARSATHLRISKGDVAEGGKVATRVTPLAPDLRREEIARMLAGATITEEARAAARRLIEATS
ncbi:DNA repair protein RecN [Lichenihabitans psoromatis]|uniref:DNA repair protein RecN n=1 Tax=Lichenihabitans psoromatis TaxID=2528642 RepID=UPI0010367C8F|nr:DNA repair protein RecN [Lichenihabitans psoromatis]